MGISSRNLGLYIGFPSPYISEYFTSAKFKFSLIVSIYYTSAMLKRVSGIGVLISCVEHVSGIGVLISCA